MNLTLNWLKPVLVITSWATGPEDGSQGGTEGLRTCHRWLQCWTCSLASSRGSLTHNNNFNLITGRPRWFALQWRGCRWTRWWGTWSGRRFRSWIYLWHHQTSFRSKLIFPNFIFLENFLRQTFLKLSKFGDPDLELKLLLLLPLPERLSYGREGAGVERAELRRGVPGLRGLGGFRAHWTAFVGSDIWVQNCIQLTCSRNDLASRI